MNMYKGKEITDVEELINGKTYFIGNEVISDYGEFFDGTEAEPHEVGVGFYPITGGSFKTKYELFEACKKYKVHIYETWKMENERS